MMDCHWDLAEYHRLLSLWISSLYRSKRVSTIATAKSWSQSPCWPLHVKSNAPFWSVLIVTCETPGVEASWSANHQCLAWNVPKRCRILPDWMLLACCLLRPWRSLTMFCWTACTTSSSVTPQWSELYGKQVTSRDKSLDLDVKMRQLWSGTVWIAPGVHEILQGEASLIVHFKAIWPARFDNCRCHCEEA